MEPTEGADKDRSTKLVAIGTTDAKQTEASAEEEKGPAALDAAESAHTEAEEDTAPAVLPDTKLSDTPEFEFIAPNRLIPKKTLKVRAFQLLDDGRWGVILPANFNPNNFVPAIASATPATPTDPTMPLSAQRLSAAMVSTSSKVGQTSELPVITEPVPEKSHTNM